MDEPNSVNIAYQHWTLYFICKWRNLTSCV